MYKNAKPISISRNRIFFSKVSFWSFSCVYQFYFESFIIIFKDKSLITESEKLCLGNVEKNQIFNKKIPIKAKTKTIPPFSMVEVLHRFWLHMHLVTFSPSSPVVSKQLSSSRSLYRSAIS